ncbi:HEAT repeat domain-containing protein [Streptomyces sp. KR80]|uniref:HEAT repeat domain-containing protein n=1 Tax=Streptomyces sp. KR80 TaxID=3457426 RepID=UPI003FD5325A
MEEEFRALEERLRGEAARVGRQAEYEHLVALVRGGPAADRPGAAPGPERSAADSARAEPDRVGFALLSGLGEPARAELARALTEPARPLQEREFAAFVLGCSGDRRAFETLVLLLNHRDPPRCATAAYALARLGDPRTARAAAALATNSLRTSYALHPVRLLTVLCAPESVPALIATLERLLSPRDPHWRVALACVEGLGALGDVRAAEVLEAARGHPRLAAAASAALARLPRRRTP